MWHEERLLIDGELVPAEGNRTFETINPATGAVFGTAADASVGDAKRSIEAARRAFDTTDWSTDHAFRARCLRQLRDAMTAHSEELRDLTIAEVGAPRMLTTMAQLDSPVESLGYVADLAESYEWQSPLGEASP